MAADISTTTDFGIELVSGPATPGTVDDFELFFARRALARLKSLIGRQGLLDLLADEIAEGNAYLAEQARLSEGRFRAGTTVLAVRGLKAIQFIKWLEGSFAHEDILLAGEPEHFVIGTNPDTSVTIVENLGPYVCSVNLPGFHVAPTWAEEAKDELLDEAEFPFRRLAAMHTPDGTMVGRVLTQFGDSAEGFTAHLTGYFPTACSDVVLEQHLQHLAVEFRNWIAAAGADAGH